MILDQNGKPVFPSRSEGLFSSESLAALNRMALEATRNELEFYREIWGRVLDHRGDPVFSKLPKVGQTIEVKRPWRFAK